VLDKIQIRVDGTPVERLSVERRDSKYVLVVSDPKYGRFAASGLKLEISRDGNQWVVVTEHDIVALFMSELR
jgi:hypothetical protein